MLDVSLPSYLTVGRNKAMRCAVHRLFCLTVLTQTLVGWVGCDGGGTKPGIASQPPNYLAGVWEIVDSSWGCGLNVQHKQERIAVDTICTGGPDLAEAHFYRIWERYWSEFYGWGWEASLVTASGGIDKTGAAIQTQGTITKGRCTAKLVVWAEGVFDSNAWNLLSRMDLEFAGDTCGMGADTFRTCVVFKTTFLRIEDAVEPCNDTAGLY